MTPQNFRKAAVPESTELYKMLHEERVSLGEEARKLEMSTLTAVAALYAWLATHDVRGAPWYIGVPLVLLATFRATVLDQRILLMKKYLKDLEQQYFKDKAELFGYESYFSKCTAPKSKWYMHLRYTVAIFWIVLICVSVIAPHFLQK